MFARFWSQTAGGLPRVFWTLWSSMLVNRVGAFAMLFLPLYLKSGRGVSLTMAGLITAGYGIGGACGSLLGGVLADTIGRRRTLLLANYTAASLMLALGFAQPLWLIALLTLAVGVFHSMPGPALVAAIIDVTPEHNRSRAFNLQFWAFNLGTAVAAALAGVVASSGFLLLFLVDAAMTAVTGTIIFFAVPETLGRSSPRGGAGRTRGGLGTALTDPFFMIFVGLTFVLAFLGAQTSMLQLAMNADGLPPEAYGIVAALPGLLIVLGQLFVPRLLQGRVKGRVLATALLFTGLGYTSVAFANVLPAYLVAAAIWTVGSMLAAPPNAEVIAELAPAELRARYQAVFYLVFPAAGFLAPAAGGWSLDHLGSWHWAIVGGLGLAAAAGHLVAGKSRDRRVRSLHGSPASAAEEIAAADAAAGDLAQLPSEIRG
ncbi:MFS transporter [Hamadaea tsunoensis]|uniref:MFS transporter n=1 Tax=Hamadaea tsunoensis TaxID=53368 RepID=UPI0003FDB472|nr:MFS transporter [Hamadaea tsunoensis]